MLPVSKKVVAIVPVSVTNAGTATGVAVDTLGYDFAEIDVFATTSNDVTNNPSVLKLQESTTTDATNFADITAAVGDGVGGFTIANAVTQGQWVATFKVNVRTGLRKRYLRVLASPLTTQIFAGIANLHRGEEAPVTTTAANVNNLVEI